MSIEQPIKAAQRYASRDGRLAAALSAHDGGAGKRLREALRQHVDPGANLVLFVRTVTRLRRRAMIANLLVAPSLLPPGPARLVHGVARGAAVTAGVALVGIGVLGAFNLVLAPLLLAHLPLPPPAARAMANLNCGMDTAAIVDAEGDHVFAASASGKPCHRLAFTLPVTNESARAIERAVVATEGEHDHPFLSAGGHDWRGIARYAASRILPASGIRGGSSPFLSAVEAAAGQPTTAVSDKPANMWASTLLHARMTRNQRRHFLAEAPILGYVRGRPVGGQVFLDFFAMPLPTVAWPCLVSAAFREPLAPGRKLSRAQLRQAVRCADQTASESDRTAVMAALEAYTAPTVEPLSENMARLVWEGIRAGQKPLPVGKVRLRFSLGRQSSFERALERELQDVILPRLNLALQQEGGRVALKSMIMFARPNVDGSLDLVAGWSSHAGLLFGRPSIGFGSQHKIVPMLLAAKNPSGLICNRTVGNISNLSGPPPAPNCETPAAWVSLDMAFGTSMNTPFAALAEDQSGAFKRLQNTLGFTAGSSIPVYAHPLGSGGPSAPPSRIVEIHAALHHAAAGRAARSQGLSVADGLARDGVNFYAGGIDEATAERAAVILEAPVRFGTLRGWAAERLSRGWQAVSGKSGTTETPQKAVLGRSQTVTFSGPDGEALIAFGWVESSDAKVSLGPINHHHVQKLIAAGLAAIEKENGNDSQEP